MFAPSTIAWAHVWSSVSAAALRASQISFRPSKAGAVSQNSSRLLRSWPSVSGICEVHGGRSFFSGWFRPRVTAIKQNKHQFTSPSFVSGGSDPTALAKYHDRKRQVVENGANLPEYCQTDHWNWLERLDLVLFPCNRPFCPVKNGTIGTEIKLYRLKAATENSFSVKTEFFVCSTLTENPHLIFAETVTSVINKKGHACDFQ